MEHHGDAPAAADVGVVMVLGVGCLDPCLGLALSMQLLSPRDIYSEIQEFNLN